MATGTVPSPQIEAHLEKVLGSATFRGAERSRRLLRFIVEETLQGRADRLKDYTLGVEALGRGDDFDPRTDPSARAEASRLRSRLDVYYRTEGASDEVRIVLPKGGYVPVFAARTAATTSVAAAVEEKSATATASEPVRSAWRWASVWPPVIAGLLAIVATWWVVRQQGASAPTSEIRVEVTTPPTTDPASLALSPDGQTLAFVATGGDVPRLWTRSLASATARSLAGTEYATFPFWSPDGRAIGFFAEGKIKGIDLQTKLVRTLSTAPVPAGAAWNRDGVILHPLVPDSALFRTTGDDGSLTPATQLAQGQTGHRGPAFLPDGRRFLFYAAGSPAARGIYIGELGTFRTRRLLDADGPAVFAPPGHLLYVRGSTLFAHAFDTATGSVHGEPIAIAEQVTNESSAGLSPIAAAASGTIAYRAGAVGPRRQLIWVDRSGKDVGRIGTAEERGPAYGSLSPDGQRLAVQRATDGNTDIWLVDLERGTSLRFTSEPQADIAPAWSPRGDRIAYSSLVNGVFELFEKPLDGGEPRLLLRTGVAKQITDWSRDGRYLLYRTVTTVPRADNDIWALALDGDRVPSPIVQTHFEERDAQFSPDGRWIAFQSNESGRHEVYIQPFRADGERLRISTDGGVQARWRADGRELFYLTLDGQLMAVSIDPVDRGRSLHAGAPVPLFRTQLGAVQGIALHSYAVSADGRRFLLDAVLEQQTAPIALILNWNHSP